MSHINGSSGVTIAGLQTLDKYKSLDAVGRVSRDATGTETYSGNLDDPALTSGLNNAYQLLTLEKSSPHLELNQLTEGLAFSDTATHAVDQVSAALTELRSLSVRASEFSMTEDERDDAQERANELLNEIHRIATETTFAGNVIFDGSIPSVEFNTTGSGTISLQTISLDPKSLGLQPGEYVSTGQRASLGSHDIGAQGIQEGDAELTVLDRLHLVFERSQRSDNLFSRSLNSQAITSVQDTSELTDPFDTDYGSGIAKTAVERINAIQSSGSGSVPDVYATAQTLFTADQVQDEDYAGRVDETQAFNVAKGVIARGDLKINGVAVDETSFQDNDATGTLTAAINHLSQQTGVIASVNNDGVLELTSDDGRDIVLSTQTVDATNLIFGGGEKRFDRQFDQLRIAGTISISADEKFSIVGTSATTLGLDGLTEQDALSNSPTQTNVYNVNLKSTSGASASLSYIDKALEQIRVFNRNLQGFTRDLTTAVSSVTGYRLTETQAASLASTSAQAMNSDSQGALAAQANASTVQAMFLLRD